jgi:hypothetical protein
MKNQIDKEMLHAYKRIINKLITCGLHPWLQHLDNKASKALKTYLCDDIQIDLLLVPPHTHQQNVTECTIHTFKNHFVAGL